MLFKKLFTRTLLLTVVLLTIGLSAWACVARTEVGTPSQAPAQQWQQTGIWVDGLGEVTVTPDIVQLNLGIQAESKTVAEAQRQARDAMDKVMNVLKSNGIADKDIQTQSFRIEQITRYDPKTNTTEVQGYRVSNMVMVKIRKTGDAGLIIDAAAAAGGDLTRIGGISFTVDDPKPYLTQARDKAMEDAMAKAAQLAKDGQVKLGKPVFVSESSGSTPPPRPILPMAAKADMGGAAPTDISPGEMKISLSVQVHFAID